MKRINRASILIAVIALGILALRAVFLGDYIIAGGFLFATIISGMMFIYIKQE